MRATRAEARPHGHDVSRCQAENREGARSAKSAAARLALGLPAVRRPNSRARVLRGCAACARRRAGPPGARFGSPESYTPKHLAEKILTSKAALEGERKQVTVLFADLKGSMELLADRDPEEARKLLDPVLERMMEAVHRYEGTVNQVMGDGIMALFGAPLAHEDHAVRACYAALDMQAALRRYAEESGARRGSRSRSVSALTPGRWSSAPSAPTSAWTTLRSARPRTWPPGWSSSPGPAATLLTADTLRLAEGYIEVKSARPGSRERAGGPRRGPELIGPGRCGRAYKRPRAEG